MLRLALGMRFKLSCRADQSHAGATHSVHVVSCQVLAVVTSAGQLGLVQAKEADLWEPTTEAELDQLEEEGLQLAKLQPQTVTLQGKLADGALVR